MSINKEGPGTRSNSSTGTEKVLGAGRHLPDTLGPSRAGPVVPWTTGSPQRKRGCRGQPQLGWGTVIGEEQGRQAPAQSHTRL